MSMFMHLQLAYQRINNVPMHRNGCTVLMQFPSLHCCLWEYSTGKPKKPDY